MAKRELFAYLHVRDAAAALRFYVQAFGATELFRLTEPAGRIGHAELDFGGPILMVSDEYPEMGIQGPAAGAPTSVSLHLHVDDADATIARAMAAGATLERPPQDEFYGERSGVVRDPFGHRWNIGHAIEQVTPQEMQRRYDALMKG
ncbi:MAG TPA: VOC family protein [Ramlibacter sp.]|nr:VOC family protein [Ramlibacter sp.]